MTVHNCIKYSRFFFHTANPILRSFLRQNAYPPDTCCALTEFCLVRPILFSPSSLFRRRPRSLSSLLSLPCGGLTSSSSSPPFPSHRSSIPRRRSKSWRPSSPRPYMAATGSSIFVSPSMTISMQNLIYIFSFNRMMCRSVDPCRRCGFYASKLFLYIYDRFVQIL